MWEVDQALDEPTSIHATRDATAGGRAYSGFVTLSAEGPDADASASGNLARASMCSWRVSFEPAIVATKTDAETIVSAIMLSDAISA